MEDRKYIFGVLGIAASILSAVMAVNYVVNPLGIYNAPRIAGFNDVYPAATAYARLKKTEDVKRLKPSVIITGSSRADIAFDPRPEFFGDAVAYNLGLPASTIREQRAMLEFAGAASRLDTAIITLDFFAFNARRPENKQFEPARLVPPFSIWDTYGTIAALDTLTASIKHLRHIRQLERRAVILPNGRKTNADTGFDISRNGARHLFDDPPNAAEISTDNFTFNYSDAPGDTTFRHLEAMLDFTRRHGIKVILLIPPVHVTYIRALEKSGMGDMVAAWKDRLATIVRANAAIYDADAYPLWDFAYKNPWTVESVPAPGDKTTRLRWFWDSNHATPALGDMVLGRVLGLADAPQELGRRL